MNERPAHPQAKPIEVAVIDSMLDAAQRAARLGERPMREILDALPVAVYTTDAGGRLTHFNRAAVEFSGRTPELGTDRWCVSWKLYRTDGTPLPHEECPMATSLKEGRPIRGAEAIAERPDGTRVTFRPFPTPLRDESGKIVGGVNMLLDVTEQREMEAALYESEDRYEQLMALMPAAAYVCEAKNRTITFCNRHAAALWGREPARGELQERFFGAQRIWRPDGAPLRPGDTPMVLALREGRTFRDEEMVIERPDGTRANVLVNVDPIRDVHGGVSGTINVFHDVTAIREAEKSMRNLASIVDSSDDAIMGMTLEGTITAWNRAAERMYGYTDAEALGRHIHLIVPDARRAEEEDVLARLRQGEKIEHFETQRRRRDGTLVDISLTVSPIRDRAGRISGISKIARDISERKRVEAEAREADRRKDEFLATLSHELRNPLAPIRTALQLLQNPQQERHAVERAQAVLGRQVNQMVKLVDELLDLSRISRGTIVPEKAPTDLRDVVNAAIETSQPLVAAAGHRLRVALPDAPVTVLADATRIAQIVANLLNNAAKYTPAGGEIHLALRARDGEALVSVRDTGIGIDARNLEKVFEMFAQVGAPSIAGKQGLGIGLAISRKLAALHGGGIDARSAGAGQGSEFVLRLPLAATSQRTTMPQDDTAPARGRALRILIVDDNVDAAETTALLLRAEGHDARVAHDGASGVQAVREAVKNQAAPDVVLLDLSLPGLDGYAVADQLRGLRRELPIVAVSGHGLPQHRERSRAHGFAAHLVKPVEPQALFDVLSRLAAEAAQP